MPRIFGASVTAGSKALIAFLSRESVMRTIISSSKSQALVPLLQTLGRHSARITKDLSKTRVGYHVVRDHFGASSRKLRPLPEIEGFGPIATEALSTKRCLLYYDRLHTLYQGLVNLKRRGGEGAAVVEVGVYQGGTSYFMARTIETLGLNTTLHACDTFSGHDRRDINVDHDRHEADLFTETSEDAVRTLLKPFPFARLHVGRIQETLTQLPERIGFVHLDVDLYEPTLFGLREFSKRLVPGGMIVVDDYGSRSCPGVVEAVDAFLAEYDAVNRVALDTGQCILLFR